MGLLSAQATKAPDRAVRVLKTCSSFASDSSANQTAVAKLGGIPPLIAWLASTAPTCQAQAAQALLCIATDNPVTQQVRRRLAWRTDGHRPPPRC